MYSQRSFFQLSKLHLAIPTPTSPHSGILSPPLLYQHCRSFANIQATHTHTHSLSFSLALCSRQIARKSARKYTFVVVGRLIRPKLDTYPTDSASLVLARSRARRIECCLYVLQASESSLRQYNALRDLSRQLTLPFSRGGSFFRRGSCKVWESWLNFFDAVDCC